MLLAVFYMFWFSGCVLGPSGEYKMVLVGGSLLDHYKSYRSLLRL